MIVLAGVAVAINRAIVHAMRTRREGPPRVVLAGDESDLDLARAHLAANVSELVVVAEVDDPVAVVEVAREAAGQRRAARDGGWLDEWYPRTIGRLDRLNVTTLLRVTGRETLFGLDRLREVGGLPFVLLLPQTMSSSQRHFKRLLDLFLLLLTAPVWLPCSAASPSTSSGRGPPAALPAGPGGRGGRDLRDGEVPHHAARRRGRRGRPAPAGDPRVIPACRWVRSTRADDCRRSSTSSPGRCRSSAPAPSAPSSPRASRRRSPVTPDGTRSAGPTGLAQIHGRYHTDAQYKLGYDLQYLVNWSPVLDLEIIARTIWVILARRV